MNKKEYICLEWSVDCHKRYTEYLEGKKEKNIPPHKKYCDYDGNFFSVRNKTYTFCSYKPIGLQEVSVVTPNTVLFYLKKKRIAIELDKYYGK